MNLLTPFSWLWNSTGLSNNDRGYQESAGSGGDSTTAGISVTDERALQLSAVWSCVQIITNTVTGLPLDIFRTDKEGNRSPIKQRHYMTDMLLHSPNQFMKPRDFRAAMTVQMCLWSNAYAEILRNGDVIVGMIPLRPGRMRAFIDENGDLTYHYRTDQGIRVYAPKSILHLKGFGTDGIVGLERNSFARESYGVAMSADQFAAKQFANGGRPGGTLNVDKFLTVEQRASLAELYSNLSAGAAKSNRLWVLEGGMEYNALDFSADQMQMLGSRLHQLGEIARYFGVPDVLIGAGSAGSSAWPASFEQQMLSFLTFTIQPYLDEWESSLRYSLLPKGSDIGVDHNTAPLVKMDSTAKAGYLSKLVQNGLATRNEARKLLNLSEVAGGDSLTVQTNLTPIELLEAIASVPQNDQPAGELPDEIRQ